LAFILCFEAIGGTPISPRSPSACREMLSARDPQLDRFVWPAPGQIPLGAHKHNQQIKQTTRLNGLTRHSDDDAWRANTGAILGTAGNHFVVRSSDSQANSRNR
jgi:hypothetical protein